MILKSLALEAAIHRDTYVAMLCAALPQHGDKTRFAQTTGIVSRGFLSYVTSDARQRDLGPRKAEEIAAHLSWPPEIRQQFVEHVILHREAQLRRQEALRLAWRDYTPAVFLNHLRGEFAANDLSVNAEEVRLRYRAIRDECLDLLRRIHPQRSPLDYVEVCLAYCFVQSVLDRPDEALFYSKIASALLRDQKATALRSEHAQYDDLLIQSKKAEASAYHIMNLAERSFHSGSDALNELEHVQLRPARNNELEHVQVRVARNKVHLYVTQLRALPEMPASGIREVRRLAKKAYKVSEGLASEQEYRTQCFNIQRALGDAETQYGNARQGGRLLQPLVEQSGALMGEYLVLRAGLLRSYAKQQFATGDEQGGTATLRATLKLAVEGGFTHQIRQNRKYFGAIVDTLLCELASADNTGR